MAVSNAVLKQYPSMDKALVEELYQKALARNAAKIVVLDDDPTGVQTVHDISVFTDWSVDSIREGFEEESNVFYILTNSRSMRSEETKMVHTLIAERICQVASEKNKPYLIISRSDSTLRGHFPLETETLRNVIEAWDKTKMDGEILCPFFPEGGRYTIDNIHYVQNGDVLIPAAETEFAADKTFGYQHSSIPEYIMEKTNGRYKAEDVSCISLQTIREMDVEAITRQLETVREFQKVCVNAIEYDDLKVVAAAVFRAIERGKHFMFRSAAGLVKILGGISDRPLLTHDEMVQENHSNGGLIVVGSHTQKTTEQLNELLHMENIRPVHFKSSLVLESEEIFEAEIRRCVAEAEEAIVCGKTAVCYTDRQLLTLPNDTKESALERSVRISDGVQRLVGELTVRPAFVIAKGGITSSDIGKKALAVRRARVMGQIRAGIPVWQLGAESRFPDMPYVIFPGNVGTSSTLREAFEILQKSPS